MLQIRIKEVAQRRGFKDVRSLVAATGLPDSTIRRAWAGGFTRIDTETLEALLRVLKCKSTQELLHYSPNGGGK